MKLPLLRGHIKPALRSDERCAALALVLAVPTVLTSVTGSFITSLESWVREISSPFTISTLSVLREIPFWPSVVTLE